MTDPHILALGLTYKPDTNDMRNSAAVAVADDLDADGYDITRRDRHVDGSGYSTLSELIEREKPNVVLQLVPHSETVTELNELQPALEGDGVRVLRFGMNDPLEPSSSDD